MFKKDAYQEHELLYRKPAFKSSNYIFMDNKALVLNFKKKKKKNVVSRRICSKHFT